MSAGRWGRFTVTGSAAVEARIESIVSEVANVVADNVSSGALEALVLLGGYGRGEGGVELRGAEEHPHNNLDFLLIVRRGDPTQLRARIARATEAIARHYGLGLDFGAISAAALSRSPCLVMWADMRFGHKTILGNPDFVPGLEHFRSDRIAPDDVRNLLVNRGTLLLINQLLQDDRDLSESDRRVVVKHEMKAIIGYGDALLFFLGDYHWSYVEKQKRMRARHDVPARFRALYEEAIAFRFEPDYGSFLAAHPQPRALIPDLAAIHLDCESRRLRKAGLEWEAYPEAAFRHAASEDVTSVRGVARKARNWLRLRAAPSPAALGWVARVGMKTTGTRGAMSILFPAVAYDLQCPSFRALARDILGTSGVDGATLRRAYLRAWSEHGDPNFPQVLSGLGLTLEEPKVVGTAPAAPGR